MVTDDEAQIRALVQQRVTALRDRDAATLTAHYADRAVLFDAVGPLRHVGADAEAERVGAWLSSYDGPIDYRIGDLDVTVGDTVAFCHYLYRVGGTMIDGTEVGMWVRATVCFRRLDGAWTIVHEHNSVPFDGATGAASVDLSP